MATLPYGAAEADAPKAKCKELSESEFHSLCGTEGACFSVYEGLVLDLKNFSHPGDRYAGGRSILAQFHGQDLTNWFNLAHSADKKAQNVMKARVVAKLKEPQALIGPEDRDFRQLRDRYVAEGRFATNIARDAFTNLQPFVLLALGLAAWSSWIGVVTVFFGWVKLFWWFHEIMHDTVMPNGVWRDRVANYLGILLYVVPFKDTGRTHMVHHAFTNWLDLDTAIQQSSPFQFHQYHQGRSPKWFVRIQVLVFFAVALPMYPFYLLFKKLSGDLHLALLIILRLVLGFWANQWALLWLPVMAGGFCAFAASLNHFHMEMRLPESKPTSFVRAMAMPTQNVNGGFVWSCLCGGLDSHIEHHLFPTLPQQSLPGIRLDVQALLSRHGITYNNLPVLSVMKRLALRLLDPYAENGIQLNSISAMWGRLESLVGPQDDDLTSTTWKPASVKSLTRRRVSKDGNRNVEALAGQAANDGNSTEVLPNTANS